jgi:hypothetical protein
MLTLDGKLTNRKVDKNLEMFHLFHQLLRLLRRTVIFWMNMLLKTNEIFLKFQRRIVHLIKDGRNDYCVH